jgi:hypothetical protein
VTGVVGVRGHLVAVEAHVGRRLELDSLLSAEDSAILQSLMNAGHADRVEFMG